MRLVIPSLLCLSLLVLGTKRASAAAFGEGMKAYKAFQFEKANKLFQKALKLEKTTKRKRDIHLHMAVGYYNLGKTAEAKASYTKALKLDPKAKIPGEQAPQVTAFFSTIQKSLNPPKRRKPPPVRPRVLPRVPPRRTIVRRVTPPLKVRVVSKRRQLPTPKPKRRSFAARHAVSITLVALGLAAAGASIGTGIAYSSANGVYEAQLKEKAQHKAEVIQQQHESAFQAGLATTILLGGGGALVLTGVIVFFFEK